MILFLPEAATEFGAGAAKALMAAGGVDLARGAELDPGRRAEQVAQILRRLGADQLDPRDDTDAATAAGELCRVAGASALPYPVVAFLLRDQHDGLPLAVVPEGRVRVDHGDLFDLWRVATIDGRCSVAAPARERLGSKLGPFVTDLALTSGGQRLDGSGDVAMHLTLTAWRILGVAERALQLAVDHVKGRVQFGQTIAQFQAVQFQLADAAVATDGLRELCHWTLWRLSTPSGTMADALALRLHALEVGRAVLRASQQLHGAAGFCDEYDVSILARHVQPDLRLPFGEQSTATALVDAITELGFEGLFPHGATQS